MDLGILIGTVDIKIDQEYFLSHKELTLVEDTCRRKSNKKLDGLLCSNR